MIYTFYVTKGNALLILSRGKIGGRNNDKADRYTMRKWKDVVDHNHCGHLITRLVMSEGGLSLELRNKEVCKDYDVWRSVLPA